MLGTVLWRAGGLCFIDLLVGWKKKGEENINVPGKELVYLVVHNE